MPAGEEQQHLIVGRISGLFGVRGWVKIYSHTQPLDNILQYKPWQIRVRGSWQEICPVEGKLHGKGLIARLEGIDDRDLAATLLDSEIAIFRHQLPVAGADEMYWADLVGLRVVTLEGVELGVIDHLLETGANDVLVVKGERERLLPYVAGVVETVDLDVGLVRVDWDADF